MGVLKAGAAFTILDPAYPAAWLASIVGSARPRALLRIEAAGALPDLVSSAAACSGVILPSLATARREGFLRDYPAMPPVVVVSPDSPACLGFTSGSTGLPKGIIGRPVEPEEIGRAHV